MVTKHMTTPPADYGHRLIPTLVDEYAQKDPDYVFAMIPRTVNFADGLEKITISTFARAVNEIAWRCESVLGKSTDFDTIAYIGPSQLLTPRILTAPGLTPSSGSQILGYCHRCFEGRLQGKSTPLNDGSLTIELR